MEQSDLQKKLAAYQHNLSAVEAALVQDPNNQQYVELRNNLKEYIELTKDLLGISDKPSAATYTSTLADHVDSGLSSKSVAGKEVTVGQYVSAYNTTQGKYINAIVTEARPGTASCTVMFLGYGLHEQVQIPSLRVAEFCKPSQLAVGTVCEGIYSADGQWYNARIDEVTADGRYAVTYTDYGNSEYIDIRHIRLKHMAQPAGAGGKDKKRKEPEIDKLINDDGEFVVPEKLKIQPNDSEDVKANKRKKLHALKSAFRQKKSEQEKNQKAQSWKSFDAKAASKSGKVKGFMSSGKKESIFKTSEEGKVGVTGSGKGTTQFKHIDVHKVRKKVDGGDDDDE